MDEWNIHCKILGVPKDASPAEIKSAYMAQAKLFHPDKHQNDDVAKQKFQQLQESYSYLIKGQKPYTAATKPNSNSEHTQSSIKNKSQIIWLSISVICLITLAVFIVKWPEQPKIIFKPPLPKQDIEEVLKQRRIFVYEIGSNNKSCTLLNSESDHYDDFVTSKERFSNANCGGNVRAFFDKTTMRRLFVIAQTQDSCMCQVNYLKNKPPLDMNKNEFNDADLE